MAIPVEAFFDELSKIAEQDEFGAKLPKKDAALD